MRTKQSSHHARQARAQIRRVLVSVGEALELESAYEVKERAGAIHGPGRAHLFERGREAGFEIFLPGGKSAADFSVACGMKNKLVLGADHLAFCEFAARDLENQIDETLRGGRWNFTLELEQQRVRFGDIKTKRFPDEVFARFEVVGQGTERDLGLRGNPAMRDSVRAACRDHAKRCDQDLLPPAFGRVRRP